MKNNTIGKRIAEARINRNITQEHLEELSGLSVSTISRIETGKYMPTIENLLKLSEILDVGLDYFLYDLLPHNKDIQSPAIQDAISKVGGVSYPSCCMWSSSESSKYFAWYSNFKYLYCLSDGNKSVNSENHVRPVLEF